VGRRKEAREKRGGAIMDVQRHGREELKALVEKAREEGHGQLEEDEKTSCRKKIAKQSKRCGRKEKNDEEEEEVKKE
jgi:hypothetical protein